MIRHIATRCRRQKVQTGWRTRQLGKMQRLSPANKKIQIWIMSIRKWTSHRGLWERVGTVRVDFSRIEFFYSFNKIWLSNKCLGVIWLIIAHFNEIIKWKYRQHYLTTKFGTVWEFFLITCQPSVHRRNEYLNNENLNTRFLCKMDFYKIIFQMCLLFKCPILRQWGSEYQTNYLETRFYPN